MEEEIITQKRQTQRQRQVWCILMLDGGSTHPEAGDPDRQEKRHDDDMISPSYYNGDEDCFVFLIEQTM